MTRPAWKPGEHLLAIGSLIVSILSVVVAYTALTVARDAATPALSASLQVGQSCADKVDEAVCRMSVFLENFGQSGVAVRGVVPRMYAGLQLLDARANALEGSGVGLEYRVYLFDEDRAYMDPCDHVNATWQFNSNAIFPLTVFSEERVQLVADIVIQDTEDRWLLRGNSYPIGSYEEPPLPEPSHFSSQFRVLLDDGRSIDTPLEPCSIIEQRIR